MERNASPVWPEASSGVGVTLGELLEEIREGTSRLEAGFVAAGMARQLAQADAFRLRVLDRNLPNYTVEELTLTCEAFATVTVPAALATGELGHARDDAARILRILTTLRTVTQGRRRLTGHTTVNVNSTLLSSAFTSPDVRAALSILIRAFSDFAVVDEDMTRKRLPFAFNVGFIVPGTVLLTAVGLVFFLLTSVAFATGGIAISPNGVKVNGVSSALRRVSPAQATPTSSPAPIPTVTPTVVSQPSNQTSSQVGSPPPPSPTLTVSRSSVQPCFGSPDSFTLTYTNGTGPLHWSANWQDTTNIGVKPATGTLQPTGSGGSATITVSLLNDAAFNGTITVTTSAGLSQSVTYDSSSC